MASQHAQTATLTGTELRTDTFYHRIPQGVKIKFVF